MDPHSSKGNRAGKEGVISESKSGPRISDSVGHENVNITANDTDTAYSYTTAYECVITYEDAISTDSSRAVQGSWENISSSSERRDQNLVDSEQRIAKLLDGVNPDHKDVCHDLEPTEEFEEKNMPLVTEIEKINTDQLCSLIITGVLEGDPGSSENSTDTLDLEREMRKLTKDQKERVKETASKLYDVSQKLMDLIGSQTGDDTEDCYWSSSIPSRLNESSRQESDNPQDSPQYQSAEKKHGKHFRKVPPRIEGQDIEIISPVGDSQETPSGSTQQQQEEDTSSETETTCCFNFRSICKRGEGRNQPEKETQTSTQTLTRHEKKKKSTQKNQKILPQDSGSEDTP